jgi:uncharacterized LabA/DUF88 family protein
MSNSDKDSASNKTKVMPCSGQIITASESDCKFDLKRSSNRTLSLRKTISPNNFGVAEGGEIIKVKPRSKCRYIDRACKTSDHCDISVLTKEKCSTESSDRSPTNISISETVSFQKNAPTSIDFFIDGQNLFHSIKNLYKYRHLNVDIVSLCKAIANRMGRKLGKIRFYTGISSPITSPHWHEYWSNRLKSLTMDGVECFSTELRYINGHGTEKGIDVMMALDIFERASSGPGTIIVFSQDNDLAVAARRALEKARELQYKVEIASAFPVQNLEVRRGIVGTTEIRIDRLFYDQHLEKEDSRSEHMRRVHESGWDEKAKQNYTCQIH